VLALTLWAGLGEVECLINPGECSKGSGTMGGVDGGELLGSFKLGRVDCLRSRVGEDLW